MNFELIMAQRLQLILKEFKEFVCFNNLSMQALQKIAEYIIEKRIASVNQYVKLCELRGWFIDYPCTLEDGNVQPAKHEKQEILMNKIKLQNELTLVAQQAKNLKEIQKLDKQKRKQLNIEQKQKQLESIKKKNQEEQFRLFNKQKEKEARKKYHQYKLNKLIEKVKKKQKLNNFSVKTEELSTASVYHQMEEVDQSILKQEIPLQMYIDEVLAFLQLEWRNFENSFL